ncbi:hypothetical protein ACFL08_00910 [Patescibacteria group bacterium]
MNLEKRKRPCSNPKCNELGVEVCPDCNVHGEVPRLPCSFCDGTGKIPWLSEEIKRATGSSHGTCWACEGTGSERLRSIVRCQKVIREFLDRRILKALAVSIYAGESKRATCSEWLRANLCLFPSDDLIRKLFFKKCPKCEGDEYKSCPVCGDEWDKFNVEPSDDHD